MVQSDDGFAIAEKDLLLRGPGDFFGTRQWGMPRFKVAHLVRDRELLAEARQVAYRYAEEAPEAELHDVLARADWERRFGLASVG
jgi:ATP-dependent DNA helicase RecG